MAAEDRHLLQGLSWGSTGCGVEESAPGLCSPSFAGETLWTKDREQERMVLLPREMLGPSQPLAQTQ